MLRDHGADAGSAMGGSGADRHGRGDDDNADLPGSGAPAGEGKGHITLMSRNFDVSQATFTTPPKTLSRLGQARLFISLAVAAWPTRAPAAR
ncbi:MAG TPA: hypothetical protein VFE41_35410 [Acetobacteraceae bacterium]|nr:hypothetical protein [Acetobacteraceae bacterium]